VVVPEPESESEEEDEDEEEDQEEESSEEDVEIASSSCSKALAPLNRVVRRPLVLVVTAGVFLTLVVVVVVVVDLALLDAALLRDGLLLTLRRPNESHRVEAISPFHRRLNRPWTTRILGFQVNRAAAQCQQQRCR
jgi:hypothetical protein